MKKEETKALTSNALDSSIIIHYITFNKFHSVFDHSCTSLSKTTDTACHLLVIYYIGFKLEVNRYYIDLI